MNEVRLLSFSRGTGIEFPKKDFEELKTQFSRYEEVYEELGGILGWLTYFGYYYYQIGTKRR